MKQKVPTVLCILDGFGINPDLEGNAVLQAHKPNFDYLWNHFPHTKLITHGERVGLPAGQMGNSEVGHMNIGAGRVVEQWLVRIGRLLREDALPTIESYKKFIINTKESKTIHIIGLCSNGGVHSHIEHLLLVIERVRKDFSGKIAIHIICDGRDTDQRSATTFISKVEEIIQNLKEVSIASLCGRFFAMDRDKRWDRSQAAYKLYTEGKGERFSSAIEAIESSYKNGVTDEFIEPAVINESLIKKEDGVLFYNFREDRMRQIVSSITENRFPNFDRSVVVPASHVLCFTEYDKTFGLPVIFEPQSLKDHLGQTISKAGFTQLRVAETEKFPHVTYFLNAGVETPYENESREIVPSPRDIKTYDLKPEMSANGVKDVVVKSLNSDLYDAIIVNFANCDMVGHSGKIEAAIKAVEAVDQCLGEVMNAIKNKNGNLIVIADHGNAEQMIHYDTRTPHTAHTTFYVPMIVCQFDCNAQSYTLYDDVALCDVAPTMLELLGLDIPDLMSGKSVLVHKSQE